MLWWVAVAWFVTALARWIAWRGSDAAHTIRTRKLVVELIAVAGWSIALVAIAGLLFDQPVTGMIATSGIVAIVLGLALQNTLADLFAGLALNVERPYRAGDWITFDGIEGQVIETNWRATHVRNRFGDLVVVPNGSIAKARLVNHCLPTKRSLLRVLVGLSNETDPQEASAVLREAAAATSRILTDPGPVILLNNFDGTTVVYAVFVYLEDYAAVPFIRSELIANIVTHTNRRGIILSIPRQEVVLRPDLVPAANG
jgi:small-conductance mechanosensitive channel